MTGAGSTKPPGRTGDRSAADGAGISVGRLAVVVVANLKMLARNRSALFFSLLFPLVFMFIFGLVFGSGDQSKVRLEYLGDGPLVAALAQQRTVVLSRASSEAAAVQRVKDGKDDAALVVSGSHATLYYSKVLPTQAAIVQGIVNGTADAVNLSSAHVPPTVTVAPRSVESSRLRYVDFLVPGLIAMSLSQSAVFGVAGALVSFRERGIIRRLRVTPLPISEFAVARLVSHVVLALAQTVVLLAVGRLAFGVRLQANVLALAPLVIVGALCFIVMGFFVGAVSKSQEAANAIGNIVTLPMVFLAGVFFPLTSAPGWLQQTARFLPLTYLANGLRDVAIRGHSVASTGADLLVLGGTAVGLAAVAVRVWRWDA
jgi:ABC-2 type transport system permease protein